MIKESYARNPERNQRQSKFLQRFQGRTSAIGKAGLLSLLEQHQPSSPLYENHNGNISRYLQEAKNSQRESFEMSRKVSMNSEYQFHGDADKRSSNQSFRTELPRRSSMEQMGSMSKLGSTNSSSIPKLPQIGKQKHEYKMQSSTELPPRRNSYNMQALKNKDTSQHLQFLNLFEQRLKRNNMKK